MQLEVLAVAAHPDDAEITCGGTLIRLVDKGRKVGVLDLTAGEMGTLGSAEERLREADDAANIMGLTIRENLHLKDSVLEDAVENKRMIAAVIRKYKPQTVILPLKDKQRHPDHRMASILGYGACFLAGLAKADIEGDPHRPHSIIYASSFVDMTPSFYVDISAQFDRKKQAVAAYRSQFDGSPRSKEIFKPGNSILELLEIYHRKYGVDVGCRYAETFWIAEPLLIDDPSALAVRSI
ncbi:MAG: bacillithiol biosynthesis deacetylase BshB1 [candidate division Zixibacteria bacterium]|nr:bacillithiol biosynthesis deacetylase BshB1 [candidate division Zixibacteria bacterium]